MKDICVVTGSRAEYGLLKPLMAMLKKDNDLNMSVIATGMHLSPDFGLTYREIEEDGFTIDEKVDSMLASDTAEGISDSMGRTISGMARAIERIKPEIIVVLGDRFEIFSSVAAAVVCRVPVAHISGGDLTFGAFDESFRHAITKMSHIHFTTNESSRKNVIQLGEDPKKVFAVGSLGVDSIKQTKFLSREEFEEKAGFKLKPRNLMVTYHPATWGSGAPAEEFGVILGALDSLDGMGLIFTKSNADTGGRKINSMIEEYVAKNGAKAVCFDSMGQRMYLSALQFVDAVVGNSSSGIAEAPSFGIGTVNIGERQEGRLKGDSVIDCAPTKEALADAFRKIYNRQFNEKIKAAYNPYGDGKTAPRITAVLKGLAPEPLKKKFHALDFKVMP